MSDPLRDALQALVDQYRGTDGYLVPVQSLENILDRHKPLGIPPTYRANTKPTPRTLHHRKLKIAGEAMGFRVHEESNRRWLLYNADGSTAWEIGFSKAGYFNVARGYSHFHRTNTVYAADHRDHAYTDTPAQLLAHFIEQELTPKERP